MAHHDGRAVSIPTNGHFASRPAETEKTSRQPTQERRGVPASRESILVASLFSSPASIVLSNAVGILVMLISWQWTGDGTFSALAAIAILVLLGRMATLVRYRLACHEGEGHQALRRWDLEFQIGATLFAVLQGICCFHAIAATTLPAVQILNVIAAVAFASGYVARNAARPKYVIIQVLCLCIPMMVALERSNQPSYRTIAIFIILYMMTNFVIVLSLNRNLKALADASAAAQDKEASSRKHAEQAHLALRSMTHGLVTFDASLVCELQNDRHGDLYGVGAETNDLEAMLAGAIKARRLSRSDATLIRQDVNRTLRQQATSARELTTPCGSTLLVHAKPTDTGGVLLVTEDFTERKLTQQKIETLARTDPLTGLANRHELDRMLASIGPGFREGIGSVAILYIDLDDFKTVNDSLGHGVGDKVLVAIAKRIRSAFRQTDFLARFGGDEFVAIIPSADGEISLAAAERLMLALAPPVIVGDRKFTIGASIGIAIGPRHGLDGDSLMTAADLALYEAKTTGKNRASQFQPEMASSFKRRTELENEMREGLGSGQFEVHYQPIVEIASRRVVALEALLRWNHPAKGRISPAEFIPIAERSDLISDLGEWVLRSAAADIVRLPSEVSVSINVSPMQFRQPGRLVAAIRSIIEDRHVPAERLELELTESVLVDDTEQTLATMAELRALGVRFSLDDFGTGYASIGYLATYSFDKVKIDRSFASVILENDASRSIVELVQHLAERIGFTVVAEGLESQVQVEAIAATGICLAQGYFFGRPEPIGPLAKRLAVSTVISED
ncbi:putative bifunctional diguanylate cyclase/phosphodiesterase [Jiella pacifica]|uniref:EAL domain-containing protein n=1 Tax=Jiella pacifica TaxID=2696469 RepID=A0A6N9T4V5_9HYPH|nr:EAL domain-containing protein [Jiella pacifica]NDW06270.1 EAL domain-containing protein [Jiella pacifica]